MYYKFNEEMSMLSAIECSVAMPKLTHRSAPVSSFRLWPSPLVSAFGPRLWPAPLGRAIGSAFGQGLWSAPLARAFGHFCKGF